MNARAVANEFAKMRRLGLWGVAVFMGLAVVGLALFTVVSTPGLSPENVDAWHALLAGMSLAIGVLFPLLLAVLASRLTDIEHQGNGWLPQAVSGLTPGGVCRAKLAALASVVAAVTVGSSVLVLAVGRLVVGISAPLPLAHWAGFTGCALAINLVVLALHILLSARVNNQLVALGVGVLGSVLGGFSRGLPVVVAHLTPWGYYALVQGAESRVDGFVAVPLAYPSVAGLAAFGAIGFALFTRHFDRQEA